MARERPSMNIGMKYRVLALGLVLSFLTPAFPAVGTSAGGGAGHPGGRTAPDHNMNLAADLSKASLQNTVVRPGYGATLEGLADYTVKPRFDVNISGAQQEIVKVAVNSRGNSFFTWTEKAPSYDVRAACFDPSGSMIGSTIPVAVESYSEWHPAVAVNSMDDFLVVWMDRRNASTVQLYGQLFGPDGNRSGDEVQLTNSTVGAEWPAVAAEPDGGFLLAWSPTGSGSVEVQRFDAGLEKVGPEITSIPYFNMDLTIEDVELAVNTNGSFLVACSDKVQQIPTDVYGLRGQWHSANGTKVGAQVAFIPDNSNFQNVASLSTAPYGDFLIAWEKTARWYNESGVQFGGDISLPGDAPSAVAESDGYFIVGYSGIGFDLKARLYDHGGNAVGPDMILGSDLSVSMVYCMALAPDDSFTFVWYERPGMTEYDLHACRGIRPFQAMGVLETGELSPLDLTAWTAVEINATLPNPASNSLILSVSTDHGTSWSPLPANGSLASAGNSSSIRLKATFGTLDSSTSPILHSLAAGYIENRPPSVSLPSDLNALTYTPVNITANGSDPDGDPLLYTWTQASGPELGINGTTGMVLPFTATAAGIYKLGVTANDGFNDSPPAYTYVMVNARPNVPTLTVSTPTEGQLVNRSELAVVFTVTDFAITQTGGHIHYKLDTAGEVMWFSTAPFNLTGLTEGNHVLKIYLADVNHTRLPNPESYVTVNFTVGNLPQLPDLSISSTDIKLNPSSPKDSDTVAISVTVHNTGTADAGPFTVRFFVDGTALPDQDVVILAKGGSKVVEAKWKATGGSHNISVQVNPGGGLPESSLSNNGASVKLSVSKAETSGASMLLIGVVVLIIIVVVVVLAVMMMRRRKPTTVVQYQPPPQQAPAVTAPYPPSGPNVAPAVPHVQAPPPAQGPPAGPSQMPPGPASAPPSGPSPPPQAPPGPQPPPAVPPPGN